jgi:hypothetical protein
MGLGAKNRSLDDGWDQNRYPTRDQLYDRPERIVLVSCQLNRSPPENEENLTGSIFRFVCVSSQMRSSQPAIACPISSGLSSCTKWRPATTTRC